MNSSSGRWACGHETVSAFVLVALALLALPLRAQPLWAPREPSLAVVLGAAPMAQAPDAGDGRPRPVVAKREAEQHPKERARGVRGALIGATLGAAAGAVLVRLHCDVANCMTHPDTYRIMLSGVGIGAALGFALDAAIASRQRGMQLRLALGHQLTSL